MTNKLADTFNEYGTPVTLFACPGCNTTFTVCPAVEDEDLHHWAGCLGTTCPTYDPARDVDKLFDGDSDEGTVYRVGDRSHFKVIDGGATSQAGTQRSEVSSNPSPTTPTGERET